MYYGSTIEELRLQDPTLKSGPLDGQRIKDLLNLDFFFYGMGNSEENAKARARKESLLQPIAEYAWSIGVPQQGKGVARGREFTTRAVYYKKGTANDLLVSVDKFTDNGETKISMYTVDAPALAFEKVIPSNGLPIQPAEPKGLSVDEINTLKTTVDEFKNIPSITNAEVEQSLNLVIEPLGAMLNEYWTKLPPTDKSYIQNAIINGFIAMQTKLNRPIAMPASYPKEVIDVYISLPPFQPQKASEQPIQMVKTQPQPNASTVQPIAQDKPALLSFEPASGQAMQPPVKIPTELIKSDPHSPIQSNDLGKVALIGGIAYILYRLYNRQK